MDSQPTEKLVKREAAKQHVRQFLSAIPSIKFVGFEDLRIMDYTPSPNDFPEKWKELSKIPSPSDEERVITWIKDILKSENAHGQYYLLFKDAGWALVEFERNYDWVAPIWRRGHWMELWRADKRYYYMFIGEEGYWRAYKIEMFSVPRPWPEKK